MTHTRVLSLMQWAGWVVIAGLCVVVGLLWARIDRQVAQNKADIAAMKSYSDVQDAQMEREARLGRERLERRWGEFLMPTLRQQHHALQSLPLPPEHVRPLPEWLQEKP